MIVVKDKTLTFSSTSLTPFPVLKGDSMSTIGGTTGVSNASELAAMSMSGEYYLTDDIDLSAAGTWTPLGTPAAPFTGKFYGRGCKIYGMTATNLVGGSYAGLFGVTDGAYIDGLTIEDAEVTATDNYVGAIVGRCVDTNITNCSVGGDSIITGDQIVGGAVGQSVDSYIHIVECCHNVVVKGNTYVGGIVGSVQGVGGVVGTLTNSLKDCFASVVITCNSNYQGGIVGADDADAVLTNCYCMCWKDYDVTNSGGVSPTSLGTYNNCFYNADTWEDTEGPGSGKTWAQLAESSLYTTAGWSATAWDMTGDYTAFSSDVLIPDSGEGTVYLFYDLNDSHDGQATVGGKTLSGEASFYRHLACGIVVGDSTNFPLYGVTSPGIFTFSTTPDTIDGLFVHGLNPDVLLKIFTTFIIDIPEVDPNLYSGLPYFQVSVT